MDPFLITARQMVKDINDYDLKVGAFANTEGLKVKVQNL